MGPFVIMALAINNLVAFIFLGIAFLSGPPAFRYSTIELAVRFIAYGLMVSLFFSLISLGLRYRFKIYFSPEPRGTLKFFLLQLSFLFLVFILISITIFFVLPSLR
jgi:hypothetical protein